MSMMKRAYAYLDGWLFSQGIADVCGFIARPVRNIATVRKEPCSSLGMMGPREKKAEELGVYHANMSIHRLDTSIGAWDEEL